MKPLRELYGHTLASNFGPIALKAVRKKMIDAGLSRGPINQRISRIKHLFKWAVSEELVDASLHHGLLSVEGLKAGRSEARERPKIMPVSDEHIDAILPELNRHVRGLVQIQRFTGMRPGEACTMKRSEIDMASEEDWTYRPSHHKTTWRGKRRAISIGPRGRELLKTFFTDNPDDYLFSPRRMMAERDVERRAKRKSKVQPSQVCRKKAKNKNRLRDRYYRQVYLNTIKRACLKVGIPPWHPNQIRHNYGTKARKIRGLEGAQASLGHSRANVTETYAEIAVGLAAEIAAQIG